MSSTPHVSDPGTYWTVRDPHEEITMEARFNFYGNTVAAKFGKYINSAGKAVTESTLPAATQELVKIRASQINGCAVCTDMHTKDAGHAGESQLRLNLVAVWPDAKVFTEAERAALELTEQGTRIADAAGGVTDEAWANAAKHYDDDQLAALVCLIALINAYNRLNVIAKQPGGDYQPGQWG
jgi:AhpD family alkylhydroperoxidase